MQFFLSMKPMFFLRLEKQIASSAMSWYQVSVLGHSYLVRYAHFRPPVFLRLLEHYEGTMFRTTNRIEAIDPAFESRTDLIIPFENLQSNARRDIWAAFLEQVVHERQNISQSDLDELAKADLDGRQIKSMFKTGLKLAKFQNMPLGIKHLQEVIGLRRKALLAVRAGRAPL